MSNMSEQPYLEPCPFCGSTPNYSHSDTNVIERITCDNCNNIFRFDNINLTSLVYKDSVIINKWNNRNNKKLTHTIIKDE